MSRTSNEDTRYRIMRLIEEYPEITQRELADKLGVSAGGVNYCLKALVDKGLVKAKNFKNSNNKAGYLYLLTPAGLTEKTFLTRRFLARKLEEYEALRDEVESLQAEIAEEDGA
ncbi:MAG: MarR family EPS-associated transcriptional regulator [Methylocystaceae bacterium]|nr:MarR family EPS-associated transcriptional regulator [Methylocystaceae bacterium]